jgi:hypothetical protein
MLYRWLWNSTQEKLVTLFSIKVNMLIMIVNFEFLVIRTDSIEDLEPLIDSKYHFQCLVIYILLSYFLNVFTDCILH